MASLLIRNLPEATKKALRRRAAANGRSMEEEARQILDIEIRRDRSLPREGLGTRLRRIWVESGAVGALDIPARSELPFHPAALVRDDDDEK
jgi:plasmid stability protein